MWHFRTRSNNTSKAHYQFFWQSTAALSTVQQFKDCIEKCLESFGSWDDTSYNVSKVTKQNENKGKKSSSVASQLVTWESLTGGLYILWCRRGITSHAKGITEWNKVQSTSVFLELHQYLAVIPCVTYAVTIPTEVTWPAMQCRHVTTCFAINAGVLILKTAHWKALSDYPTKAIGCDTEVDTATLVIWLLPYSNFIQHQSHVNSAELEASREWKWCQGMQCTCKNIIGVTVRTSEPNNHSNGISEARMCDMFLVTHSEWCFNCGIKEVWNRTSIWEGYWLEKI